ncbi:MAG: hypothetical protein CVV23_06225 [Ignavibacteriae bacterium HGW-Ignavibacteriae-2]|jgi:hypothetical protein|nr:MAG: hypothetical protein CVV23_06225 [Ignavibacteriae bacterium HGW-Ignavibacteriae-2]
MSLIPIIYTSLLIFSVAFLAVLIISYISYKIKQSSSVAYVTPKNRVPSEQKIPYVQRPVYNPKPQEFESDHYSRRREVRPYSQTNSVYYRNERNIGNKKIDIIYKEKPRTNQPSLKATRMNIIDDLSTRPQRTERTRSYTEARQLEFSNFAEGNILRYYEDF